MEDQNLILEKQSSLANSSLNRFQKNRPACFDSSVQQGYYETMLANYGYTDGSGEYYIAVDTDKCNGCGDCVAACPAHLFEVATDDYDEQKAAVKEDLRNKIKYLCGTCKPTSGYTTLPCLKACTPGAIKHLW